MVRQRRVATVTATIGMLLAGCGGTTVSSAERAAPPAVVTTAAVSEPTAAAPTPIPIAPTPTPLPLLTRSLMFSGDVLSHTPVIAQAQRYGQQSGWAFDYRPMFADISARLARADLAICVLETPISQDNIGLDGYPTFEAPRELPDALVDAGYDGCATASNHSMDRWAEGVGVTLDQMDRASLGHAGMARTESEARAPTIYDLDGVRVAHLSYTYGLNGFVLPDDQPWLVNVTDADAIVAEAELARAAGADLVVLSIQWGNEYQRAPSVEQQSLARSLTAAGSIDLIVGNHVHVVQPVTVINDVPVIYGLGNSLSNQSDNCCRVGTQDGVIIEATVQGNGDTGFAVTGLAFAPTWVDRSDFTIIDLVSALADSETDEGRRAVYQTSLERTVEAIHSLGDEIPLAS